VATHEHNSASGRSDAQPDLYLQLRGELDLTAEPVLGDLSRRSAQRRPGHIVIDTSNVSFVDCRGYGLLLSFARNAEAAGVKVSFKNPSRAVTRLTSLLSPSASRLDDSDARARCARPVPDPSIIHQTKARRIP
jgi:anti-anti-sigma factor